MVNKFKATQGRYCRYVDRYCGNVDVGYVDNYNRKRLEQPNH